MLISLFGLDSNFYLQDRGYCVLCLALISANKKWSPFRIFVQNSSLEFPTLKFFSTAVTNIHIKCISYVLYLKCCAVRLVSYHTAFATCLLLNTAVCTLHSAGLHGVTMACRDRSNETAAGPGFFLSREHISVDYLRRLWEIFGSSDIDRAPYKCTYGMICNVCVCPPT